MILTIGNGHLSNSLCLYTFLASQVVLVVRNLPANAGDIRDVVSVPRSGRCPRGGHGNPLSILAWRVPWTEEPGELQTIELQRVRYDWNDLAYNLHILISKESWMKIKENLFQLLNILNSPRFLWCFCGDTVNGVIYPFTLNTDEMW